MNDQTKQNETESMGAASAVERRVMPADAECYHTWTSGRQGEKGSWCQDCGVKVLEVETRPCEGCEHYRNVFAGAVCKRHLMAVSPIMLVTFKIANGTCWEERHNG